MSEATSGSEPTLSRYESASRGVERSLEQPVRHLHRALADVARMMAPEPRTLAPDGRVNTPLELARLRFRAPTGVALRHDTLYLLDNAPGSTAVWRVVRGDAERVYTQSFWKWHLRSVIAGMPFLLLALLVTDRYQKKRAARRSPAVASAAKTP